MSWIDSHCHLKSFYQKKVLDVVLRRAMLSGVEKMICVGTDLKTSEKAVELANTDSEIYATVGYHPHESKDTQKGYLYEFEEMSKNPKVIDEDTFVSDALKIINKHKITSLFIVKKLKNKKPSGIIHLHDCLRLKN